MDLFKALEDGKLHALYVMTTNPGQSLPNVDRWRKALEERRTFLVVAEAFHPTRTSELADVVLPAALWAEKEGVYGCTERRYQLLEQAVKPAGAARPRLRDPLRPGAAAGAREALAVARRPRTHGRRFLTLCKGTAYDFSGMSRAALKEAHGLLWPLPSPGHPGTKRRYVKGEDPLVPADHPQRVKFYGRPDQRAVVWLRPQQPPAEVGGRGVSLSLHHRPNHRALAHGHDDPKLPGAPGRELRGGRGAAPRRRREARRPDAAIREGHLTARRGDVPREARAGARALASRSVHMHDAEHMCNRVTIEAVDPVSKQPEFKILRGEGREGRDRVIVAGVVIETVPGAAPRVAARLLHEPGLELLGGDGDRRLAAMFTGPAGGALEALAERLVHAFPDVIGVFPTYVAEDPEEAPPAAKPARDSS